MGQYQKQQIFPFSIFIFIFQVYEREDKMRRNETISEYWKKLCRLLYNVRLTSEPVIGAEFAEASEASCKLRDNRRVWLKRLLADFFKYFYMEL